MSLYLFAFILHLGPDCVSYFPLVMGDLNDRDLIITHISQPIDVIAHVVDRKSVV